MEEIKQEERATEYPEIMNVEELCGFLNVNREIVLGFVDDGMPYFTLTKNPNSHKRFRKSDVALWISTTRNKKK